MYFYIAKCLPKTKCYMAQRLVLLTHQSLQFTVSGVLCKLVGVAVLWFAYL